jgi:hypothetical protein
VRGTAPRQEILHNAFIHLSADASAARLDERTGGNMSRDLHVTSPSMTGQDVLDVQKQLATLGLSPGPLDAAYGPATAAAVKDFQQAHRLDVDGVVGPQTLAALAAAAADPAGSAPLARSSSSIGREALIEAAKHIGVKEDPPGSNKTEFGVWYGVNGVAWCNIFVSYCFQIGANHTICNGFNGAGTRAGKGCAFVPTTEAWLKATGLWVGRTEPQPGDIAIFNWDGGRPDHIGIVEQNLGNGRFQTIEGNTAVGNDSNGGQVMRRERQILQVDGFGRVVS